MVILILALVTNDQLLWGRWELVSNPNAPAGFIASMEFQRGGKVVQITEYLGKTQAHIDSYKLEWPVFSITSTRKGSEVTETFKILKLTSTRLHFLRGEEESILKR